MQQVDYIDKDGTVKRNTEIFNLPADGSEQSRLRQRYEAAMQEVFASGGELLSIQQGKVGRNDPCPCGSKRKFKRCCERKLNAALQSKAAG